MAIPPLNNYAIGIFAWYEHGLAFNDTEYTDLHNQLYDKSSESPDEYYDGTFDYIYKIVGYAPDRTNSYNVRVRKDGYILAWFDTGIESIYDFNFNANPPFSQLAIERIMDNAGVSGFSFAKSYYYNFDYPDATKVRWFGENNTMALPTNKYFYFTLPASGIQYHYVNQHNYCCHYAESPLDETYLNVLTHPDYNPIGVQNTIRTYVKNYAPFSDRVYVNDNIVCSISYSFNAYHYAYAVVVALITPV